MNSVLHALMDVLNDRKTSSPAVSYTARLYAGGLITIADKIQEEAREVCEAAAEPSEQGRQHLIGEASDLIYHLFVMLAYRAVTIDDIERELAARFGRSGLDISEKNG